MNYRNVAHLNSAIQRWAGELPQNIGLVVGVPRSGLLAAMLLALHRNLPVSDLEGFIDGRVLGTGQRGKSSRWAHDQIDNDLILVVDDSIRTGHEMKRVKAKIASTGLPYQMKYSAVYATEESKTLVDYYGEIVELPRVFEWNIMHHGVLADSCVVIEGVLCRDPLREENDDGVLYERFITTVPSLVVPTCEIGWLVTCRLEKYRSLTEKWLAQNGVRYKKLLMMDLPDKASRQAAGGHATFKAMHYRNTKAELFIESSRHQAMEIARLTGKSVYCMDSREMLQPGFVTQGVHHPKQLLKSLLQRSTLGRKVLLAYAWLH
jgi:orotate phosphoribosyltransferase